MRIRAVRREKGLSQKQLGAAVGLDQGSISRIERGERRITVDQMVAIAAVLGVRPGDLIGDDDRTA